MLAKLLALLPQILAAVVAVETVIKAPGATKKQIVLGVITAAAQAGEQIPVPIVQGISALIDQTVGTLNASGIFSSGSVAVPKV